MKVKATWCIAMLVGGLWLWVSGVSIMQFHSVSLLFENVMYIPQCPIQTVESPRFGGFRVSCHFSGLVAGLAL